MIVFFTGDYSLGDFWSQVELLKYNDGTSIECDEPFCRQGGSDSFQRTSAHDLNKGS